MAHLVLGVSVLLQFVAAVMALLLIRRTGWRAAWSLIAIAMALMGARRAISFYNLLTSSHSHAPEDSAEIVALIISLLMVIGVVALGPLFTRAQRSENALSVSETSLKRAQRIARLGNWDWDIPTNCLNVSSELYRLVATHPEDFESTTEEAFTFVHPEDKDTVWKLLAEALTSGTPADFEHRIIRTDGSVGIVHQVAKSEFDASGNPVRMTGTVQDITDRKQVEDLNSRLGRVIEGSVNEIYVFDSETLRFLQVNRGARENLGYSLEELKTMTPLDIKPLITDDFFGKLIEPLLSAQEDLVKFETVHRRKDGSIYDVAVRLQLAQQESPPVFFAIIEDITERRQTEAALRQAQKMEAFGQLTSGLTHDFRNLLTVMIGNLDLVELKMSAEDPLLPKVQKASATA
jgi:PAS domain S-box-containing protein